jgi:hypothetical protein
MKFCFYVLLLSSALCSAFEFCFMFCFEGAGLQPRRKQPVNTGALAPEGTNASLDQILLIVYPA